MIPGAKMLFGENEKKPKYTLDPKGLRATAMRSHDVNGLTEATMCYWSRGIRWWAIAPCLVEDGGWGSCCMGSHNGDSMLYARFGVGSSSGEAIITYDCSQHASEWVHLAVSRDRNGMATFFVNGSMVGTASTSNAPFQNNGGFCPYGGVNTTILETQEGSGYASWAFFDRVLGSQEVESVMNKGTLERQDGLLIGVNLDEGEGTYLHDIVSGQHSEIISGQPSWTVLLPF